MKKTAEQSKNKSVGVKQQYLWLSMGDGATPECYGDDFSALADALYEGRVDPPPFDWLVSQRGIGGGFQSGRFEAPVNHVGLYWGDDKGEVIRNLTKAERKSVEKKVDDLFFDNAIIRRGSTHCASPRTAQGGEDGKGQP